MAIPEEAGTGQERHNPPAINLPAILTATIVVMVAIHAVRVWLLSEQLDLEVLVNFAFLPARYDDPNLLAYAPFAGYWSPATYSLLHSDWTHVAMNMVWMAAFGAPVARRFGAFVFVMFMVATALGGSAMHYGVHPQSVSPVIGASAIVSGMMGAASRFAFGRGYSGPQVTFLPALTLVQAFQNKQVLTFLAIWFAFNFIFGSGLFPIFGEGVQIAWEAHVGGFLVGLLAFGLFDRFRTQ